VLRVTHGIAQSFAHGGDGCFASFAQT
jgi:hypothetical protein